MTGQWNSSQGRGHDRLPNWNPKNGGMLISHPITSCLTNHGELCMPPCSITNHVGFLFIDFSGGHLWVSSLRCLQRCWQVMTLCLQPCNNTISHSVVTFSRFRIRSTSKMIFTMTTAHHIGLTMNMALTSFKRTILLINFNQFLKVYKFSREQSDV